MTCPLEEGLLEKFNASEEPNNRILSQWLKRWFDFFGFEKSVMHDPLALASIFTDVCRFERRFVKVDLDKERGAVYVSDKEEAGCSPIFVATAADRNKFYQTVESALL